MKFHFKVSSFRKKSKFPSILLNPNWAYTYFFSHSEKMKDQEKICLMSLLPNKFFIFFKTSEGNNFGNGSYTTLYHILSQSITCVFQPRATVVLLAEVWWKNRIFGLIFKDIDLSGLKLKILSHKKTKQIVQRSPFIITYSYFLLLIKERSFQNKNLINSVIKINIKI